MEHHLYCIFTIFCFDLFIVFLAGCNGGARYQGEFSRPGLKFSILFDFLVLLSIN